MHRISCHEQHRNQEQMFQPELKKTAATVATTPGTISQEGRAIRPLRARTRSQRDRRDAGAGHRQLTRASLTALRLWEPGMWCGSRSPACPGSFLKSL